MINLDDKAKYTKRVGNLNNDSSVLTASTLDDINQVFYAEGTTAPISTPINLSVRYVDGNAYHDLITGSSTRNFEPKTLYVIQSDEIDAYNTQIKNVGDPNEETDGANKRYVDLLIEALEIPDEVSLDNYYEKTETSSYVELNTEFTSVKQYIDKKIDDIPDVSLDNYYEKTETSSYVELKDKFDSLDDKFVDVETNQEIAGEKLFSDKISALGGIYSVDNVEIESDLSVHKQFYIDGNLNIGQNVKNLGHYTLGVGNELTVGSYNFFYKGVDINTTTSCATIYLTNEQPRYPFPFVITNGDKSRFRIGNRWLTIELTATYLPALTAAVADNAKVWKCDNVNLKPWRNDYNQLCIDLGPNYLTNLNAVKDKFKTYINLAFTLDDGPKEYISQYSDLLINSYVTMVNSDKNNFRRCGKIVDVIDNCALSVYLGNYPNDSQRTGTGKFSSYSSFTLSGALFGDFDYDDASIVFIDKPTLSGPSNISEYSSINIGTKNIVSRRCSGVIGKQLTSEMDFAIALGRRGAALHYASFIWAPAVTLRTTNPYTFNIGLNATLALAHTLNFNWDILILGTSNNERERLYKYVWNCLTCDPILDLYIYDHSKLFGNTVEKSFTQNDSTPLVLSYIGNTKVLIKLRENCSSTLTIIFSDITDVIFEIVNENSYDVTFNCEYGHDSSSSSIKVRFLTTAAANGAVSCGTIKISKSSRTHIYITKDQLALYIRSNSSSSGDVTTPFSIYLIVNFSTLTYKCEESDVINI